VSEVEGVLREDVDDAALLRATFPPGSVTGAPKLAALAVIAELESAARQAFTGAIGFASPVAGLELSVAIRTFEIRADDIWLDVGGGIVADSDPEAEAAEALVKARPLLAAIGADLAEDASPGEAPRPPRLGPTGSDASSGAASPGEAPLPPSLGPSRSEAPSPTRAAGNVPLPLRLGPRPLPRPDPAGGVFETVLVRGGEAVALERHLDRLRASMATLYGTCPPDDLEGRARVEAARADGDCRLRLIATPDSPVGSRTLRPPSVDATWPVGEDESPGGSRTHRVGPVAIETASLPPDTGPLTIAPVTVPGGLGPHKWRDRRLLDALAAATAPAIPLLVDLDGYVLEGAWANIFVVTEDGMLVTPPLDGRILPGTTRARVLEQARGRGEPVAERPLHLDELRAAAEVRLTSSLRGTVHVELAAALFASGQPTLAEGTDEHLRGFGER
jgi:para-aminobenzoate synthetase/4-amino-4-deoxychorismate lyase